MLKAHLLTVVVAGAVISPHPAPSPPCAQDTLPIEEMPAVAHYPASSTDKVRKPDRVIRGPHTQLCRPHSIALGPAGEIYVLNVESEPRQPPSVAWVTAYPPAANGDAVPMRTLMIESRQRYNLTYGIEVDSRGYLYVLSDAPQAGSGGAVRLYAPGAEGDAQPVRVLSGPATGLNQPTDIAFAPNGDMYIPGTSWDPAGAIAVFPRDAHGNVSPARTIAGPNTLLRRPTILAFGPGDTLYALNVFRRPRPGAAPPAEITVTSYARDMSGDVEPLRSLVVTHEGKSAGWYRGITSIQSMTVDSAGAIHLWHRVRELIYVPGARGEVLPVREALVSEVPPTGGKVAVERDGSFYALSTPSCTFCD